MTFLAVLASNQALIELQLRAAIIHSVHEAWNRSSPKPQEPDFVATLVTDAVPLIAGSLNLLFSPYGIKVATTGVFSHQTPKVRHVASSVVCELGDVLFVHAHRDAGGAITRNALLFQAKVAGGSNSYTIPNNEHHQLKLYHAWPEFKYVNSGAPLNGVTRNVEPKARHSGAQYLLVDDSRYFNPAKYPITPAGHYPMAAWMAETPLKASQPLEKELLLFLSEKTGRIFGDINSSEEWSKVVWDLLKTGLAKVFNRNRSGFPSQPRHAGDMFFFTQGAQDIRNSVIAEALMNLKEAEKDVRSFLAGHNNVPPGDSFGSIGVDTEGGMNLIIIETEEEQRWNRD